MAGKIPDEILETIRDRVSIVEVVSEHVALKKSGRGYSGLCPFHSEKTPSFTVSDERGLFHCFGCGEGGTVFSFLMKVERGDFREVVEKLARRAGVTLPDTSDAKREDERGRLMQLNEAAQRRFRDALVAPSGASARSYLEQRGLTPETIERFGIGLCPREGTPLLAAIASRPQAQQAALALGLVGRRQDGRLYERFWGRITFPIRDTSGRIVGFGGRALGDQQPKYLNSPESEIFHKGNVLYGLFEAKPAVRSSRRIILVEGYMDAVVLAQAGIGEVVASLGTSLTGTQLRLASRVGERVIAFFDGDAAGQRAAVRAFENACEAGVWMHAAFLPQEHDPDSFVRAEGVEATRALLDAAAPLWDFFLARVTPARDATVPEQEEAARRMAEVLAKVKDPVRRALLLAQASERLGLDEAVLRAIRVATPRARPDEVSPEVAPPAVLQPAAPSLRREEELLIEALALDRRVLNLLKDDEPFGLLSPTAADLVREIERAWELRGTADGIVDALPPQLARRVAAGLLGEGPIAAADGLRVAQDCLARLEQRARRQRLRRARDELKRAEGRGDGDVVRATLRASQTLLAGGSEERVAGTSGAASDGEGKGRA